MSPEQIERYLYDDCYLLAVAVWELTGWPMVQIMDHYDDYPEHECSDECPGWDTRHALVQMPDGRLLDAAGPHDNYSGAEPFHDDQWFPLSVPEDEQRWVDDEVRADARQLLAELATTLT